MFQRIYNKYKRIIELGIYPVALLILPLLNYDQGVDISDSTYSLGNYMFADRLDGMWVISTFLSNKIGSQLIRLPGARQLRFANIYTGLVLSLIALVVYFVLKDDLGAKNVFLGEFAAVCFCWIPTGILYNYLSYLFMVVGALLLYKGIIKDNCKMLFLAGLILGADVFVRIPNITQMAFIIVLWAWGIIYKKSVIKKTLICIAGYLISLGICFGAIILTYGFDGIRDMISGLTGITSTDKTYTPLAMITGTLNDYIRSFKWFAIIVIVLLIGVAIFGMIYRFVISGNEDEASGMVKKVYATGCGICYMVLIALMLRFFWGRGMFSFRYYEDYTAMYEWGMMALFFSIIADVYLIVRAVRNKDDIKTESEVLLALLSLVVIFIAPFGSNNHTYQNLNNLFLILPVTFSVGFCVMRLFLSMRDNKDHKGFANSFSVGIPYSILVYVLLSVILIQSFGFHLNFVFRDGMRGEKRDCPVKNVTSLEGMYTNEQNAKEIEKICGYIEDSLPDGLILYGNCPGLTYITGIPSLMSSSWPDLDSNPVSMIEHDLDEIAKMTGDNYKVVAVIRNEEPISDAYIEKKDKIERFLDVQKFKLVMADEEFSVYEK